MMMHRQRQDQQSNRVFYELSALVLNILRSTSTPISFSDHPSPAIPAVAAPSASSSRRPVAQITPGGFASLLLGISLAMMFCGSITFFIGCMLMPWVLGLVMFLYVAGIISTLSLLGRSILYYATGPPPSPRKEIPSWKLL